MSLLSKASQVEKDLELIKNIIMSSAMEEMTKIAQRATERYHDMVDKYIAGKIVVNHNERSIIFK